MEADVSIILPVYNSEYTIAKTLDSILSQNYEKYKIIIINDGSTDKTDMICKAYSEKYNSKILYIKVENGGVSKARNIGLQNVKSDYVMFIDSDDEYEPNAIFEMINKIKSNSYDIIACGYKKVDLRTNFTKNITLKENQELTIKEFIENLKERNLFNQLWNKIYKFDIIFKNNINFDENISLGEDYKFNLEFMKKCDRAFFLNKITYKYNFNFGGLSYKYENNTIHTIFENMQFLKNIYEELNFNLLYIYKLYIKKTISCIMRIIANNEKKIAMEEIKKMYENENIVEILTNMDYINLNYIYKFMKNLLLSKNIRIIYSFGTIVLNIKKIKG